MKLKRKFYRELNKNRHILQLLKNVILICIVILAGAIAVLAVEFNNADSTISVFFDAIWWALVTITTVGYGDLVPITFWGRMIGIVFIFLGFIIFSTFTAFIASTFIDKKIKERKGLNKITDRNHVLICGWNNSARKILDYLSELDPKDIPNIVLVNELSEGVFSSLQNHYPDLQMKFINGDFTNQEILMKANIKDAKHIILLFDESKPNIAPSDERTIIASHNIAYMKLKGKISIQLHDEKYLPNIRRERISNVVIYDNLGGNLLANSTMNPSIPDFLQEVLKAAEGKGFKEMKIPYSFVNKSYKELSNNLKDEHNLIALGIISVYPEVSIEEIVSDDTSSIDQFIKRQFEESGKKFQTENVRNHVKLKPDNDYIIQDTDKVIVL
ncbi:MAG: NAD-binding protein [Candidatus Cloacimonetes bacterium]|nr:NAD-binding protein [Candidatus Cloacimonadota bacterium]